MGWAASWYGGRVCSIFFGTFYRGIGGLLFRKSQILCLSDFMLSCSVSRPFPSPFRASKLPDSVNRCQVIDQIGVSRCALHLNQFAVIYPHVALLHSNVSKCVVIFDTCAYFSFLNIICCTLLHCINLFQMICTMLLHICFTSSYCNQFAYTCCPSGAVLSFQ